MPTVRDTPITDLTVAILEEVQRSGGMLKDAARRVGAAQSWSSQVLSGRLGVGGKTAQGLAVALGMTYSQLIRTAEMFETSPESVDVSSLAARLCERDAKSVAYSPGARTESPGRAFVARTAVLLARMQADARTPTEYRSEIDSLLADAGDVGAAAFAASAAANAAAVAVRKSDADQFAAAQVRGIPKGRGK